VLAAGGSARLGRPKQLEEVRGERLLERAVRVAAEAGFDPVVAVLGAAAKRISEECDLRRSWVVVNPGWAEGMGSSVRAGVELVESFREVTGAVLMTCDMPAVTAEHLRALADAGEEVVASKYAERRGVPAYFARGRFAELRELRGDVGARELLRGAKVVELPGGEVDVDTAEDLARARERFEG